jgi:hypothetical protein
MLLMLSSPPYQIAVKLSLHVAQFGLKERDSFLLWWYWYNCCCLLICPLLLSGVCGRCQWWAAATARFLYFLLHGHRVTADRHAKYTTLFFHSHPLLHPISFFLIGQGTGKGTSSEDEVGD